MYINFYICEVDDTKEDYLSKLPDDILRSILGNLTVRDAARMTTLSNRWKYLFASTQLQLEPTCRFRCSNMFGVRHFAHSHCSYNQEKDKFMSGLYQFLRLYSGRRVDSIELRCCFAREFPSAFTHWFQSLSRISVQSLYLFFECFPYSSSQLLKFSLEVLSQSFSLVHLILSGCVVLSSPRVRFNSLTTLALRGVVLTSGHLEGVVSSCSNLKRLSIDCSELPSKLQLTGTVIDVVILDCDGGKEIDLHAAYLRTLECKIRNDVTFFFSFVPMLENVMVSRSFRPFKYSYIFGDHARDLPNQVKSLTLEFLPDQYLSKCFSALESQVISLQRRTLKRIHHSVKKNATQSDSDCMDKLSLAKLGWSSNSSVLEKRSKEVAQKAATEDADVRRSTRVHAPPRDNPAVAFLNYVNKCKED
ncbi:hypothetical protein CQW23_27202 [Capsicum baccatum]|uniref:F-box domain-containing protein n=1 Tax=Capsicum baccatum TaxID=33114 RepID=A0A2G2VCZ9_CAPBA|nr:hypothetical protein CQW23_27202 [Capsicum baccatum]